jgi:hypothetical protein
MSESTTTLSVETEPVTAPVEGVSASRSGPRALEALKWAFSFPAMLGTFLVGAVFYVVRQFFIDPDVWWHIRDGQAILSAGHWPTVDPYSFTVHGQPWIAFEWGGDVLLAWVSRIGGFQGLEMFALVAGSAIILALYAYATMCCRKSKAGFLAVALLFPLTVIQFNLRPQMLGYLFFILALIILERFRQRESGTLWLLPALMLLWVNSHGSWVIGMGTIFACWIGGLFQFKIGGIEGVPWSPKQRRQISLAFLLSLAVLPLNPYGTKLVAFPFQVGAGYPVSHANILEWFPMPFGDTWAKLFLILLLGFIVAQIAMRMTWRLEELGLCLFGMAMACIHIRFLLIFVPFFIPLLARICARGLRPYSRAKDKYVLNAIIMAAVVAAVVRYYPSRARLQEKVADQFPVRAVAYLNEHPVAGPMLNSYGFGGYLVWTGRRVFIDGRSELYEDGGVLADYIKLTKLTPGGLDVLRRYQIKSCLLAREEPLSVVLAALPEWREIYSDRTSALFVRRSVPAEQPSAREGMNTRMSSP